jgi:hypothetical protein
MKQILILFSALIIIFSSCKGEDEDVKSRFVQFEIKNESNKDATIFLYRINNDLFKSLKLNSGDSNILDEGFTRRAPSYPTYSLTLSIDSAVIIFSDNKKLIQTYAPRGYNDTINNILDDRFYNDVNGKLRFTLKQSDYLRSQ